MHTDVMNTLQFFAFKHLPPHLQVMSRPFAEAAVKLANAPAFQGDVFKALSDHVDGATPVNPQSKKALQKIDEARLLYVHGMDVDDVLNRLIEAKDCAVRALVYKHQTEVPDLFGEFG